MRTVRADYDLVTANILADIIIPLTPVIPAFLKKGGIYVTSGIIDFKEEAVKQAVPSFQSHSKNLPPDCR